MKNQKYTIDEIVDVQFKKKAFGGVRIDEVDDFLNGVIDDYEYFTEKIRELKKTNEELRNENFKIKMNVLKHATNTLDLTKEEELSEASELVEVRKVASEDVEVFEEPNTFSQTTTEAEVVTPLISEQSEPVLGAAEEAELAQLIGAAEFDNDVNNYASYTNSNEDTFAGVVNQQPQVNTQPVNPQTYNSQPVNPQVTQQQPVNPQVAQQQPVNPQVTQQTYNGQQPAAQPVNPQAYNPQTVNPQPVMPQTNQQQVSEQPAAPRTDDEMRAELMKLMQEMEELKKK